MIESFVNGILTTVGVVFFVLSQMTLYKCGDASYDEKGMYSTIYGVLMAIGLSLIIGGIGDYITSL